MGSPLWKLNPDPTVDEAHFEARLRGHVEALRRDAQRIIDRAMRSVTERVFVQGEA